ncbi:Ba221 [Baboon cytomegalovirus]|nr:Ba221 [Baboon cytomegalovirus]
MPAPPWHTAAWWITLGCASAANVAVFLTSPTVGAQSIVVHKTSLSSSSPLPPSRLSSAVPFNSPAPRSPRTTGPTRSRISAFSRRSRRQRQKPYSYCVTDTHWTTDLAFSDCTNSPSFVKLDGVRRWTLKGQVLGETSYYGSCCRLSHGENAYIIFAHGYGPAVHGHALRVDYAVTNCSRPRVPFPSRLEITFTAEVPSRCGARRLYFYGLQCSSQLAFSASGVVDAHRCPPVLSIRPFPLRLFLLDERLRTTLYLDVFLCLVLIIILSVELIPRQVVRRPVLYWRHWIESGLQYLWPWPRYTILENEKPPSHVCHITYTAPLPCVYTDLSRPSPRTLRRPAFGFILWLTTSRSQCQPAKRS